MSSSIKHRLNMLFLLVFFLTINIDGGGATLADSWITFVKESKSIIRNCMKNDTESIFYCLRTGSLDLFDRITSSDVIPLTNAVRLIRYHGQPNDNNDNGERDRMHGSNPTSKLFNMAIGNETWPARVLSRFTDVFTSHVIQVDIETAGISGTGRARHRQQQMLPMMIFGVTALGMVMVPIGFQFLALIAGKALLLSKMALLLASINGIKRVASSGVHYGLYHQDPHLHPVPWDRNDKDYHHPRNLNVNST